MIIIKFFKKVVFYIILSVLFIQDVYAVDLNENYLITSDLCLECRELKNVEEFCIKNDITIINIDKKEDFEFYQELINTKNVSSKVPVLIYNNNIYTDSSEINKIINGKSIWILSFLGLIDGFNPCAISILMIFISLLITLDKHKKIFIIGFSFIFGEILINFLLGFGILKLTNFLSEYNIFIKVIYLLSLVICLYIFIINIIDIYNGFKQKNKIKNQLNKTLKFKISTIINKNIGAKFIVIMSFFMGIIIALLEFGCTGQLYLPSIIYMENNIFYLFIYNLFFALPLIIFLFLGYFINKPEKIKDFIMQKSYLLKIIFNIVLIFLFLNILVKIV